ncbi:S8 family serine peptidase [Actinoallomurus sp. NPDC050550]|uniref:S8 family serine peptidase n=1 Tax=Actinoallomurus sp. NPDC050550 TaxID=3154937 RepID=UPI0033DFC37B
MKIVWRFAAGIIAVASAVMPAATASALPQPRQEEWWFSAWGIQSDVWPTTTGVGVTVAVLDSGVNAKLPELVGSVLAGSDTTGRKTDGRQDLDEKDYGHGTAMAALIAAHGGGATNFVGIAPGAKILPVHVTLRVGDQINQYEDYANGIRYSVDHGAKVISISQGANSATLPNHCDPDLQNAVSYAVQRDVIVVAAAGNSGAGSNWPELPASCAGVLAVGAIDKTLQPWGGTQRQSYVAVAAPGVGGTVGKDGRYFAKSWGTSIATALTSGAIALIRSRNPEMPARTVVQRLIATARPLGSPKWNDRTGYGAIQITAAMNPNRYPVPSNAPNPVYEGFEKWPVSHSVGAKTAPPTPGSSVSQAPRKSTHTSRRIVAIFIAIAAIAAAGLLIGAILWRRRANASKIASAAEMQAHARSYNARSGGHANEG